MRNNIFILFILLFLLSCGADNEDFFEPPELRADEQLTSQIWKINYFNDGDQNKADFNNSFVEFNTDNTFDVLDENNNIFSGKWAIDKNLLVIQSDGLILTPKNAIEGEWLITYSEDGVIQIKERDGTDEFTFAKPEQQQLPIICNDADAIITGKGWIVDKLTKNGSDDLAGDDTKFEFLKDHSFKTSDGSTGLWTTGIRCTKLQLDFGTDHSDLSKFWDIQYLSENTIKLNYTTNQFDWNLELVRENQESDSLEIAHTTCSEVNQVLDSTTWTLSTVKIGNQINTAKYAGYIFSFNENHTILALTSNESTKGDWKLSDACDEIQFTISDNNILAEILNGQWRLFFISERKMKLLSTVDNTLREIHFSR